MGLRVPGNGPMVAAGLDSWAGGRVRHSDMGTGWNTGSHYRAGISAPAVHPADYPVL
jgi:hypothetical protein